jgi:hypothetical protein
MSSVSSVSKNFTRQTMTYVLMGLMVLFGAGLTGCGGGDSATSTDAPAQQEVLAPFELKINKVELTPKLGARMAEGGKFFVVTFEVENTSNGDFNLNFEEFKVRNITENAAEQYQQGVEQISEEDYVAEFGPDRKGKLLGRGDLVHPRFKVERALIFKLPADADAAKYELYHEPLKLAFPLVSESTEVVDLTIMQNAASASSEASESSH